ncbi:unnamed protein product [Linum tenue]|uniref:BED-type domain-containing protein n=1 Tax=Linum tenue TaxID=586396 RepID=A0AAV0KPF4_9ROSI|nr:unnamed protein product [Linum tenue]
MAKCNYCKKQLVSKSNNGTTHLKNHTTICVRKKIRDGSQKILGPHYLAKGNQDLVASAFKSDFSKRELAVAITMHEYPLSMVHHHYFKRFVYSLQPLFTVPSRNTKKKEVFKIYDTERAKIQSMFDSNRGRIAITLIFGLPPIKRRGTWLLQLIILTTHRCLGAICLVKTCTLYLFKSLVYVS